MGAMHGGVLAAKHPGTADSAQDQLIAPEEVVCCCALFCMNGICCTAGMCPLWHGRPTGVHCWTPCDRLLGNHCHGGHGQGSSSSTCWQQSIAATSMAWHTHLLHTYPQLSSVNYSVVVTWCPAAAGAADAATAAVNVMPAYMQI